MKKILFLSVALLTTVALFSQGSQVQKIKELFQGEQFQLYGYGQVLAAYSEFPDRGQSKMSAQTSIDVARAYLIMRGRLGADRQFGYMLMYDFGPNASLHELYGEWLPADAFNLRLGQFKTSLTLENPISAARIETVFSTRSIAAMTGSSGDFNQYKPDGTLDKAKAGRDAGVQVSGRLFPQENHHFLEYYAGVFNGTGLNTKDNNDSKDFLGTAYAQPVKGLRVGGSVYYGRLKYGLNGDTPEDHIHNRWTVGADFHSKYFSARSEYIAATDGGLKRDGGYGLLVWKCLPDKWEVLGKYDYYDNGTYETRDITAGVNYYFAKLTRLQLNYIFTKDELLGNNNAVALQLQIYF